MTSQLDSVLKALESVEREIRDLESNLNKAKTRKVDLLKEKAQLEQKATTPNDPPKSAPEVAETPEELQARIAELQKQIEEAERQKKAKAMARARSRSPSGRKVVGDQGGRGVTLSPQGASRRKLVSRPPASPRATVQSNSTEAPKTPAGGGGNRAGWNPLGRRRRGKDESEGAQAEPPSRSPLENEAPASPAKENVAPAVQMPTTPQATQSSAEAGTLPTSPGGSRTPLDWERPGWAHAMDKQDNRAVDSDPIANPLLQHASDNGGYRRQVFAKDIELYKGTLVKHQAKAPDPRLTWIVLRINGTAVPGKIVMHLHGKDVHNLVDHFQGLKDTSVSIGGPNGASMTVQSEPPLYIKKAGAQGLDLQSGVYGVLQEGHEIVDKAVNAGEGAQILIKQAHIFPVKKSKGGL